MTLHRMDHVGIVVDDLAAVKSFFLRPAPANSRGSNHLCFAVDDLDDVLARLQAHGAGLVGEVVSYEDVYRLCYIRGPTGIIIELAEPIRDRA